jgi:hypothetical protein
MALERTGMLKGSLHALLLYDISEEIRVEELREGQGRRGLKFRGPAPEYVGFEHPPVTLFQEPVDVAAAGRCAVTVRAYDYGILTVALELPFETDWDGLVRFSARWIGAADLESRATEIAKAQAARIRGSLIDPHEGWITEDYYVVHLAEADGLSAQQLSSDHGSLIAQIVRAEPAQLADEERAEIWQSHLSYYPTDLMVVGWMAAFVYDTAEGAASAVQLLEYANTQLLEFRYYDDVLTKVLSGVYSSLEARRGGVSRWKMAREAQRLNRIRLEITQLTERVDTSIKFLSDMFYARAYRMAARKIGVTDYRDLVDEKLRTAADLYHSMVNEFHQARAFVLEAMVVAILIIELFNTFFPFRVGH